ncbi:DUF1700 domain-containing protein [Murdochiella sp. Marseille-P8839]|nr:DUF1700 domain-containing protein [Murdochiella sp. Marseille-P8839]
MTRKEYLEALNRRLARIGSEERGDAVAYYEEIFEDRGIGEKDTVPKDMPDPRQASFEILRDLQLDRLEEGEGEEIGKTKKPRASLAITVVLAILALPVGLPLAITILLVSFGLFVGFLSLFFSVASSGVGVIIGAGKELIQVLPKDFSLPRALYLIGLVSLGVFAILLVILIFRSIVRGIRQLLLRQRNKRGAYHE